MRDKLIELLKQKYDHYCDQCGVNKQSNYIENLADYLIANGVTFAEDNNVPGKCGGEERFVGINKTLTMTAGDGIRAMSDEKLAKLFTDYAKLLFEANNINAKLSETFEADALRSLKKSREVET